MTRFLSNSLNSIILLANFIFYSLTSPNFYLKVIGDFRGYGLRYLLTLTYIGTVGASAIFLYKLNPIYEYFETKIVTNYITSSIDNILVNWTDINYNGKKIITDFDEPLILNDTKNKPIAAIDPEGKLDKSEKTSILMVFGKSALRLNVSEYGFSEDNFVIEYEKLFGKKEVMIDSVYLFELLKEYLGYFEKSFIYLVFPVIFLRNFMAILLEQAFTILVVYFAMKYFVDNRTNMKSALRLVAFSCGLSALFIPLVMVSKYFGVIANYSQIWTNFLIIYALVNLRGKTI